MRGSSWRSEPAAPLRGLASVFSPCSSAQALYLSKAALGMKTSPRTSSTGVAARGAAHEHTVFVAQADRQAIQLGFDGERGIGVAGFLDDARDEFFDLA